MSDMWPMDYVSGCKNYPIQAAEQQKALNWMMQMSFAELEKRMLSYYCLHDVQYTWEAFNKLFRRTKMITLSNGVEVSEDTIVSALKKAGINVEPKHVFEAGDVAQSCFVGRPSRIIVNTNGGLKSYDLDGHHQSTGQEQFEKHNYKFIGRLTDMLRNN